MTLPLFIAGLVLLLAGSTWFSGAATVGLILVIIGGLGLLFQLLFFVGVSAAILGDRPSRRRRYKW